jgi:alpha-D-ribose 1-methylphosphonate 5-triphosphate synthase subunit PhnI
MPVAIRGGEHAIKNSLDLLAEKRRGDVKIEEITPDQIRQQLSLAVNRVMNEAGLYDPPMASLALKQAQGDNIEAAFLLRAMRTTLRRLGYSEILDLAEMAIERRIVPIFKEIAGGQFLGSTYDYSLRLLESDFTDQQEALSESVNRPDPHPIDTIKCRPASEFLAREEIMEAGKDDLFEEKVADITRQPASIPAARDTRLQMLARADEGFLTGLANSTLQGFGTNYPMLAELRVGLVPIEFEPPGLGFSIEIGEVQLTECEIINKIPVPVDGDMRLTRGYGIALGQSERKAIAMAVVDRAQRARDLGIDASAPIEDQEFVLTNCDGVDAAGLLQSLKLPHYVSFQEELSKLREMQGRTVSLAEQNK